MSRAPEAMLPRVLMIHNRYQQPGGEDFVFAQERDLLRAYGHEVETIEFSNDEVAGLGGKLSAVLGASYNHASARRVRDAIERFRPDVVHVHNWFMVASPAVFDVAYHMGVATVASLHNFRLVCANAMLLREGAPCEKCLHLDFPWHGVQHGCYRGSALQSAVVGWATASGRARGTWARIDRVITASKFARQKLLSSAARLSETQLVVKGNFIPDAGAPSPSQQRRQAALYVGRLSPEKGLPTVLAAARERTDIDFVVVGDGALAAEVQAFSQSLPNFRWHPKLERAALFALEREVSVGIVPSMWYENFPLVVPEYFAAGLPVAAADIGALQEIVADGETGARYQPGSVSGLLAALDACVSHRNEWGQRARLVYERQHTPERNYPQLLAIYRAAMASAAARKQRIA